MEENPEEKGECVIYTRTVSILEGMIGARVAGVGDRLAFLARGSGRLFGHLLRRRSILQQCHQGHSLRRSGKRRVRPKCIMESDLCVLVWFVLHGGFQVQTYAYDGVVFEAFPGTCPSLLSCRARSHPGHGDPPRQGAFPGSSFDFVVPRGAGVHP